MVQEAGVGGGGGVAHPTFYLGGPEYPLPPPLKIHLIIFESDFACSNELFQIENNQKACEFDFLCFHQWLRLDVLGRPCASASCASMINNVLFIL